MASVMRFHKTMKNECYHVMFRRKIYLSLEEIQQDIDKWLVFYNRERPHSGRYCYGKTDKPGDLTSVCQVKFELLQFKGRFASVKSNYLFLNTDLVYQPKQVTLSISRNLTHFASVAKNANERQVAIAADQLGGGHSVYEHILSSHSTLQARRLFKHLSGQVHAGDAASKKINASRHVREAVNGRLLQVNSLLTASDIKTDDNGVWGKFLNINAHSFGNNNATGYQASTRGVLLGVDAPLIDDWRFGIATGFTHSKMNND